MGNRKRGPRVLGPRRRGAGWQIVIVDPLGERPREYRSYPTEAAAEAARRWYSEQLAGIDLTVGAAIERYQAHLTARGCRQRSAEVAASAIRNLMGAALMGDGMDTITAARLRQRLALRPGEPTGRTTSIEGSEEREPVPRSVSSVATEWRQARAWLSWLEQAGLYRVPAGVARLRVEGRRGEGKEQLTGPEARAYYAEALRRARAGDEGGLAALCPLLLGVRSREILDRRVGDLDPDGVLWIRRGKTRRARRRLSVPEPLRGLLCEQAEGREPGALLLGEDEGTGRPRSSSWLADQVRAVCTAAGVPPVCPHGLRGTHATLAEESGVSPTAVASSLGHTSPAVTGRHYTLPEAREGAARERALRELEPDRKNPMVGDTGWRSNRWQRENGGENLSN